MKRLAIAAMFFAGFIGGIFFVYSCGGGGGGGGGSSASAAAMNVGTPIASLPYTISSPGLYYVTGNLSPPNGVAEGITVNADDVTIDLMGYTLDGNNSTSPGIYMNGRSNVEIRNGTIRDFDIGIQEDDAVNSAGHRIINIRAISNTTEGLSLFGRGHLVIGCTASGNGGSGIVGGGGFTISGSVAHNNTSIGISAGAGSTITGNTAISNGAIGINTDGGSTVAGNTAYQNTTTGIRAFSNSAITGNSVLLNGGHGIDAGTGGSTVVGNSANFNQNNGISLSTGSLADSNAAANNNQSSGGFSDIACSGTCYYGSNTP